MKEKELGGEEGKSSSILDSEKSVGYWCLRLIGGGNAWKSMVATTLEASV
jgi:hypothetical protein